MVVPGILDNSKEIGPKATRFLELEISRPLVAHPSKFDPSSSSSVLQTSRMPLERRRTSLVIEPSMPYIKLEKLFADAAFLTEEIDDCNEMIMAEDDGDKKSVRNKQLKTPKDSSKLRLPSGPQDFMNQTSPSKTQGSKSYQSVLTGSSNKSSYSTTTPSKTINNNSLTSEDSNKLVNGLKSKLGQIQSKIKYSRLLQQRQREQQAQREESARRMKLIHLIIIIREAIKAEEADQPILRQRRSNAVKKAGNGEATEEDQEAENTRGRGFTRIKTKLSNYLNPPPPSSSNQSRRRRTQPEKDQILLPNREIQRKSILCIYTFYLRFIQNLCCSIYQLDTILRKLYNNKGAPSSRDVRHNGSSGPTTIALEMDWFKIEFDESCLDRAGLVFENDPEGFEDEGFGRMGGWTTEATDKMCPTRTHWQRTSVTGNRLSRDSQGTVDEERIQLVVLRNLHLKFRNKERTKGIQDLSQRNPLDNEEERSFKKSNPEDQGLMKWGLKIRGRYQWSSMDSFKMIDEGELITPPVNRATSIDQEGDQLQQRHEMVEEVIRDEIKILEGEPCRNISGLKVQRVDSYNRGLKGMRIELHVRKWWQKSQAVAISLLGLLYSILSKLAAPWPKN
ncbi:hypothetical protein BY996DRAFT_8402084 [Phakopsora pachyrhizi]|nr:hypothetical protein BY996DRAFT_8402084 [Phakopsora pachyrhizi]